MVVEGVTNAQLLKPGYTYCKSMSHKLIFVKVKAKACVLVYFQHLDLIYDLLKC